MSYTVLNLYACLDISLILQVNRVVANKVFLFQILVQIPSFRLNHLCVVYRSSLVEDPSQMVVVSIKSFKRFYHTTTILYRK